MKVDLKTEKYFKNIKQVFLYLSDKCNLLCKQCLYKPNVIMGKSIEKITAKELLSVFAKLGAYKLTILGGEVTLYDIENRWNALREILSHAHDVGYRYIRIDTNGQFEDFFRVKENFKHIDEVSFSVDGYEHDINDILRGEGAFRKAKNSIRILQENMDAIRINITSCVTKQNACFSGGVDLYIKRMIEFGIKMRLSQINFHGVFKMGVPMDTWTDECHLDPYEWHEAIKRLTINYDNTIDVRLPLHIISRTEFDKKPEYYGYCPCKIGERALIHPDGIIRVCSSMLSTSYGVAHYNDSEIVWNEYNNELREHEMNKYTPCTNQKKLYSGDLCPICFSIKPFQNELIWNDSEMEKRKNNTNMLISSKE